MAKLEKLLQRVSTKPKDFSWAELLRLLTALGYALEHGSGSRRCFRHPDKQLPYFIHEPHPGSILKEYQVRDLLNFLQEENYL